MKTLYSSARTVCDTQPSARTALKAVIYFLLLVPTLGLEAQTWQRVFGDNNAQEGYSRVTPVLGACRSTPACTSCVNQTDGYIAVGAHRPGGPHNIYIVRTDNGGSMIWERTYNLNADVYGEEGRSIIELSDGSGFVVTGWTGTNTGTRAFLMKVDCDGNPLWTKTYEPAAPRFIQAAYGYDVIEARSGNGGTTNVGDLIVCGYLYDQDSYSDAFIFRTNSNGGLIWNMTYENAPASDDRFERLTEASRLTGQATGDIIAVGQTAVTSPSLLNADAYVVRVNGNNGTVGAAPQGAATYGGTLQDCFYSVIELQNPGERGATGPRVVLAGFNHDGINQGGPEIYLVKLENGDPCDPLTERIIGDRTTGYPDIAYDIREVRYPFGTGGGGPGGQTQLAQWDLVVTGETGSLTASNNRDAYLMAVNAGTLAPVLTMAYNPTGTNGSDWGRSLEIVDAVGNRTRGVVMCGIAMSDWLQVGDVEDLYLIKTNIGLSTGTECEQEWEPGSVLVDLLVDCEEPDTARPIELDSLIAEYTPRNWGDTVCTDTTNSGKAVPHIGNGSALSASEGIAYTVRAVPNPVRSGKEVNLRFEGRTPEEVAVEVTNAAGERVADLKYVSVRSEGELHMNVEDWSPGIYFILVDDGTYRSMLRIVVVE